MSSPTTSSDRLFEPDPWEVDGDRRKLLRRVGKLLDSGALVTTPHPLDGMAPLIYREGPYRSLRTPNPACLAEGDDVSVWWDQPARAIAGFGWPYR